MRANEGRLFRIERYIRVFATGPHRGRRTAGVQYRREKSEKNDVINEDRGWAWKTH